MHDLPDSATAYLFPGQGSQESAMAQLVADAAPDLLRTCREAMGCDPFRHLHEGTRFLQPAIYCATRADVRRRRESPPAVLAGHSLGEISALVAAASIGEEDGLRLVIARGALMQEAAEAHGGGAMLAVGLGGRAAERFAASAGLTLANDNGPDQAVLSGPEPAIRTAAAQARARGLRVCRLPINGAFHSPAMSELVPEFRAALDAIRIAPPRWPVLSCVTAEEFDDIPRRLAEALSHRVRWREVVLALRARGAGRFVEFGPGQVLTRLTRKILSDLGAASPELVHG